MLTPTQAADIARRSGLSLADAVALRMLADTTDEAVDLAAKFGAEGTSAGLVARLFGDDDRGGEAGPTDTTAPGDRDDGPARAFLADAFGRTPTTPTTEES